MEKTGFVLDRFENGLVVCEDIETRKIISLRADDIPEGASEGDVLIRSGDGFIIDREKTRERKRRINEIFNRLRRE